MFVLVSSSVSREDTRKMATCSNLSVSRYQINGLVSTKHRHKDQTAEFIGVRLRITAPTPLLPVTLIMSRLYSLEHKIGGP